MLVEGGQIDDDGDGMRKTELERRSESFRKLEEELLFKDSSEPKTLEPRIKIPGNAGLWQSLTALAYHPCLRSTKQAS